MKIFSLWAKNNKWPARLIIIAGIIVLNGTGIATGLLLKDLDVGIPPSFFVVLVIVTLIVTFIPVEKV